MNTAHQLHQPLPIDPAVIISTAMQTISALGSELREKGSHPDDRRHAAAMAFGVERLVGKLVTDSRYATRLAALRVAVDELAGD